jgi:cobalt/nickel transport system permease protein
MIASSGLTKRTQEEPYIMHMADALISPAVGGVAWAGAAGLAAYSARKVRLEMDDRKAPLMGVLGAFVFSAQMINFSIPGTGSSGHLGGGLLLAILLGPHAAFLTITSVLLVQALFFADGGLLALGCNVLNLGLFPCFIAYPLIYRAIAGNGLARGRMMTGAVTAAVAGLLMGAFAVVVETTASGISDLPVGSFLLFMLPIHLAIGIVEGLVTAAVVLFVYQARPELAEAANGSAEGWRGRAVAVALLLAAVVTGGALSWVASGDPDGLEWSIARATGAEEVEAPEEGTHALAAQLQEKTALMPDYAFGGEASEEASGLVQTETTVAGLVGAGLTLLVAGALALIFRPRRKSTGAPA